ncbi:dynein regulatory complex subunit 2-like [Leptopilina heterotoma]|uniref:dynein regulatory complex subunit 2-like n=1 Tax=Leptopilina heterotoma TaxID=63436 RepID=UPI001CA91EF0|nr:dynein regulatory complex subunit 2-like [Leptopilina heterotoma]
MAGKKKSKSSKLARMSDEERARYLQHRAEIELEAKRRKQELIAVFTKNKLKREDAFSRINTAKINEQWRFILRKIKCKELYEEVEYLWKNFLQSVNAKDAVINNLCEQLEIADLDHRRLQEGHIDIIDTLIVRGKQRLEVLRKMYLQSLEKIEIIDKMEFEKLKKILKDDARNVERIIYSQQKSIDEIINETKIKNAVWTYTIEYSKQGDMSEIKKRIESLMEIENLELQKVISSYESSTESKRKQYEYLKEQDEANIHEFAQFPKIHTQLFESVENLKNQLHTMKRESDETIDELKSQLERLSNKIWKLRQNLKLMQTIDTLQLKRLSVTSGNIIKELGGLLEKSCTIQYLTKLCADLEPPLLIKKYSVKDTESTREILTTGIVDLYDNMENFWQQINHVKAENILMKEERARLASENNRLRNKLRTYLISISRKIPMI